MQVTSIGSVPSFNARVESPSPLVNGEWQFISNTPQAAQPVAKKESHWLRNTIIAALGVVALTATFVGLRNIKAVENVMNSKAGFKAQETFKNKALWCIGKIGDGAKWLSNNTWGKLAGMFKKAPEVVTEAAGEAPKAA